MFQSHLGLLETTNLILANVVCLHGLPDDIVSDNGAHLFPLFGNLSSTFSAPPPSYRWDSIHFQVGDMVWLLRGNITTTRPCAKLNYQKLGPFRISECINPMAYRLDLPPHYPIHDVFHVSLGGLPSFCTSQVATFLPIELDSGNEYEVEEILDSKLSTSKTLLSGTLERIPDI